MENIECMRMLEILHDRFVRTLDIFCANIWVSLAWHFNPIHSKKKTLRIQTKIKLMSLLYSNVTVS